MILSPCVGCRYTPPLAKPPLAKPQFRGISPISCGFRSSPFVRCFKSSPQSEEKEEGGFSVLESEIPWEDNMIWSTSALYIFCLHIPLSFGGLSVVAHILHHPLLDPQTKVLSLVMLQLIELSGTVFLLSNTAKPQCKPVNFFKGNESSSSIEGRNWVVGSALALGLLLGFIFLTSLVADRLFGSEAVQSSELETIMKSGEVARSGCIALYCVVAPVLEEIVYRRFLLSSLASRMGWRKAVVISAGVFAAAHLSGEGFVQLFGIGCVLGCCYTWSGNIWSSVVVHSLYNAFTLLLSLHS